MIKTLVATAFANQDRQQAIFERQLGLVPAAAKALVRLTATQNSDDIKKTAKRMNHIASSIVLETFVEKELIQLLK